MNVVTVTIGRNVGDRGELTPHTWSEFKTSAKLALGAVFGPNVSVETHEGTGSWSGVPETSAMVSAFFYPEPSASQLTNLRDKLTRLANAYSQDAIALTIGKSELVGAYVTR